MYHRHALNDDSEFDRERLPWVNLKLIQKPLDPTICCAIFSYSVRGSATTKHFTITGSFDWRRAPLRPSSRYKSTSIRNRLRPVLCRWRRRRHWFLVLCLHSRWLIPSQYFIWIPWTRNQHAQCLPAGDGPFWKPKHLVPSWLRRCWYSSGLVMRFSVCSI